ncbi:MAG: hypothetical protein Ta2A_15420 [Treponemataceae bacterium]|nr:MAG: hypothetical protein Ta2A_15420 [Treponemataceae bacterium]
MSFPSSPVAKLALSPGVCSALQQYSPSTFKALKNLVQRGSIALLGSTAVHSFLAHYIDIPKAFDVQVKAGLKSLEYYFDVKPHGFFLPHYVTGIENTLLKYGIDWAVTDAKTVLFSKPVPQKGIFSPVLCNDSNLLLFPSITPKDASHAFCKQNSLFKRQFAHLAKAARLIEAPASLVCVLDARSLACNTADYTDVWKILAENIQAAAANIDCVYIHEIANTTDTGSIDAALTATTDRNEPERITPYFSYRKKNEQTALDKTDSQALRKERDAVLCMIDLAHRYKYEKENSNKRVLNILAKEAIFAMSGSDKWEKDSFFKMHDFLCSNMLNPALLIEAEKKHEKDFPWLTYQIFAD